MRSSKGWLAVTMTAAATFVMVGCGEGDPGSPGEVRRGPIGKADRVGSCAGTSCDGPSAQGNCWCDEACVNYGDCCDDRAAVCGGEQFCLSDDSCAVGQRCDTSVCRSNCPPGAICPAVCLGLCVPDAPADACQSDADCGPNAACQCVQPPCPPGQACPEICMFQCVPQPPPPPGPTACQSNSDCGVGAFCDHDACLPPPGCGPGDICPAVCYGACKPVVPPPAPVACWQDSECASGEYCDHNECLPPPGCGPGDICPAVCYGACKPAE